MRRPLRARGFTVLEMTAAIALLGVIVLAVATLTDLVLRRMPLTRANQDRWSFALGAVPALREDLRRTSGLAPHPRGLDPRLDQLVLDRSEGRGERLVVWSAGSGKIGRRELRRRGEDHWEEGARREWSCDFEPRIATSSLGGGRRVLVMVHAEVSPAEPRPPLRFAFAVPR